MHILQINKLYYPNVGGVETVVKQYSEYLQKQGHHVTVLTAKSHPSLRTSMEIINGVRVIRCGSLINIYSMPLSFSLFYHFIKIIRKIDIVHVHEPYPLGTLLGITASMYKKVVVTWHSDVVRQKWIKPIIEFFQHLLCGRASVITTTSLAMKDSSQVLKNCSTRVEILPLSIDLEKYEIPSISLSSTIPTRYILFCGRLSHYKGIPWLLDSIQILTDLEDITFVIVGSGELSGYVAERIKMFPHNRVIFINKFVTEKEKKDLLAKCFFFVFPSTMPSEAFGIMQIEAMAYGKPVINTNLPTGVPWVSIHEETGLTVPVGDVKQLSDAIRRLVVDNEWRECLGKQARRRVEILFSDKKVLTGLSRLYEKFL